MYVIPCCFQSLIVRLLSGLHACTALCCFPQHYRKLCDTSLLGPVHLEMALIVEANEQISFYLYFIEIWDPLNMFDF